MQLTRGALLGPFLLFALLGLLLARTPLDLVFREPRRLGCLFLPRFGQGSDVCRGWVLDSSGAATPTSAADGSADSVDSRVSHEWKNVKPLEYLTVPPRTKHTATVIFVHGLGDSGKGWEPVANMLQRDPGLQHIKWVLPHAPEMSVTANQGYIMPSWFDILEFGFSSAEDESGMLKTVQSLNQLITAEIDGSLDSSRIVLGGFSQGSTMSLLTGLTGERKLGGLVCLSGWAPLRNKFKSMLGPHALTTPIFWGTGARDPLVRIELAKTSVNFLKESIGVPETTTPVSSVPADAPVNGLDFNVYPGMQHSSCPEELAHLQAWLKRALPAKTG